MSFFKSTHTNTNRTPLPRTTTRAAAIALLHDHTSFQDQVGVVENVIITAPDANTWIVKESTTFAAGRSIEYRKVTVAVPWAGNITTTSALIDTDDGLIVVFQAPMGLNGRNIWTVEGNEGLSEGAGRLELVEDVALTGFSLLMGFVMATEKKNHVEQGLKFARSLEAKGEHEGNGEMSGK